MRDEIKKSRPTPWLGVIMGLILLWFLSPVHEWVMSLADDPVPELIEPELIRAGLRGSQALMSSDGIVAVLEARQKLAISDRIRNRIDLNHDEDIRWFRFTQDGKGLMIRSGDTVRMWDTDSWLILKTWTAHDFGSPETTVALTADRLVSALPSDDSSSVTLRCRSGEDTSDRVVTLPQRADWSFQVDPGGRCLIAVGGGKLLLIDVESGNIFDDRDCSAGRRWCISPDLRYVAWDNNRGQLWLTNDYVTLLDRETGKTFEIRDRHSPIRISHFTADSQRLVVHMGRSLAVYSRSQERIESVLANSNDVQPMVSSDPLAIYGLSSEAGTAMKWALNATGN